MLDSLSPVDAIAFALILALGLYLALAARKIAQDLYDRYQARHAPLPSPMLDLNRLEDLRYSVSSRRRELRETEQEPAQDGARSDASGLAT